MTKCKNLKDIYLSVDETEFIKAIRPPLFFVAWAKAPSHLVRIKCIIDHNPRRRRRSKSLSQVKPKPSEKGAEIKFLGKDGSIVPDACSLKYLVPSIYINIYQNLSDSK